MSIWITEGSRFPGEGSLLFLKKKKQKKIFGPLGAVLARYRAKIARSGAKVFARFF
jgi:hypothetical protein